MTAPATLIADLMHQVEKRDRQIAHLRQELESVRQSEGELRDGLKEAQERVEFAESEMMRMRLELEGEAD